MAEPDPPLPPDPPSTTTITPTFTPHPLFGSTLSCSLPTTYLDASILRPIPSHQELFLSPTTLTSILFEICEYELPSPTTIVPSAGSISPADLQACHEHFHDPIDALDRGLTRSVGRVGMGAPGVRTYAAYVVKGEIVLGGAGTTSTTKEETEGGNHGNMTTNDHAETTTDTETTTHSSNTTPSANTIRQSLLLLRLPHVLTDLVVRISVPLAELIQPDYPDNHEALRREEKMADEILSNIIETLNVEDWSLFEVR